MGAGGSGSQFPGMPPSLVSRPLPRPSHHHLPPEPSSSLCASPPAQGPLSVLRTTEGPCEHPNQITCLLSSTRGSSSVWVKLKFLTISSCYVSGPPSTSCSLQRPPSSTKSPRPLSPGPLCWLFLLPGTSCPQVPSRLHPSLRSVFRSPSQ